MPACPQNLLFARLSPNLSAARAAAASGLFTPAEAVAFENLFMKQGRPG
jgi:hypothetical protein